MILNRSNLVTMNTGFKATFQQAFDGTAIDYEPLITRVPSTDSAEEYGWLGATTGFREWVGDRVAQNLELHGYTIKNKSFENTVKVPATAVSDDKYGVYSPVFAQLGQDAKRHPAKLIYNLLAAGFATKCFDGQFFFDTDHPVLDANGVEQSVSNTGGGAGTAWYLLDTTRIIRPIILQMRKDYQFVSKDMPTDDNLFWGNELVYGADARLNVGYGLWQLAYASKQTLNAASLNAAIAAMANFKGDNGDPLGIKPSLLVVPFALRETALKLVTAELSTNGETNINKNAVDVLITSWLS